MLRWDVAADVFTLTMFNFAFSNNNNNNNNNRLATRRCYINLFYYYYYLLYTQSLLNRPICLVTLGCSSRCFTVEIVTAFLSPNIKMLNK